MWLEVTALPMPPVVNLIKHFKNLESYWLENCSYYDSRVVIYARKNVYKMAIGLYLNVLETRVLR